MLKLLPSQGYASYPHPHSTLSPTSQNPITIWINTYRLLYNIPHQLDCPGRTARRTPASRYTVWSMLDRHMAHKHKHGRWPVELSLVATSGQKIDERGSGICRTGRKPNRIAFRSTNTRIHQMWRIGRGNVVTNGLCEGEMGHNNS